MWNAIDDQLSSLDPIVAPYPRGKLKKDWPAEAICNGSGEVVPVMSCSESSRILCRIFFTPVNLRTSNLANSNFAVNNGKLKFGKNTHMAVKIIKHPECLPQLYSLSIIIYHYLSLSIYLSISIYIYILFQASSIPSTASSNCGA